MKRSTLPSRRQNTSSTMRRIRCYLQVEHLEHRWCPAVPAFSSLPGANQTIYLDFDGHITQNTQWNSYFNATTITSPAYDTDGNPSSFSPSELADIENAWQRVAEDYYPFNVNVTTVDPGVEALRNTGAGDTQWGIRAVITSDTQNTGAGGIAWINSFNWNTDTPAFIYVTSGKYVAEAASHEVGHSLGLAHDGTATSGYYSGHGSGETSWAPLMGVGYYNNVTTWDKGEYYGSNNASASANYNKGPDDLAIITTYNGFGYRPDDVGDTASSATALTVSGTSVSGAGFIGTTNDVDFFSFTTGAGQVTLNLNPYTPGPNLDIRADLYDAAGNLVATSNSPSTLSASFNLNLAAGQYFVKVDGTGFGTPGANPPSGYSDYASLGRYFISGTVVNPGQQNAHLTVNDVSVNESAGTATFTVTLTGTLFSNVTVNYATGNGTAVAPDDYTTTSGTLTFTPGGSMTQTVTVTIVDDNATEPNETFTLNLSNASGAVIDDGQGQGTIVDNDVTPTLNLSALSAAKAEGTGSTATPFTFTVTRTGSTGGPSSVNWTVGGIGGNTATANDFAGGAFPSGTVTFAAGETTKTITVNVLADSSKEKNENFRVTLSNASGAELGTSTFADGTIINDDGGGKGGGRGLIPHLFPRPGQENLPAFQHDHDEDEQGGETPATLAAKKLNSEQVVVSQLAARAESSLSQAAAMATSRTSGTGASLLNTVSQVQQALRQQSTTRLAPSTMKALTSSVVTGRTAVSNAMTVADQLFAGLKTRL